MANTANTRVIDDEAMISFRLSWPPLWQVVVEFIMRESIRLTNSRPSPRLCVAIVPAVIYIYTYMYINKLNS